MIAVEVDLHREPSGVSVAGRWQKRMETAALFGSILFRPVAPEASASLAELAEELSGSAEWYVEATQLDRNAGIALLNAGCARLAVAPDQIELWRASLPDERLAVVMYEARQLVTLQGERIDLASESALLSDPRGVAGEYFDRLATDRPDGLVPTLVVDPMGMAMGLAYSSKESLQLAVSQRAGIYWSRSRGSLWTKGETSGGRQRLLRIAADCDRDALRFTVAQAGTGFCHLGSYSCFGDDRNLATVFRRIQDRIKSGSPGSYSRRLSDNTSLLARKLLEEAQELADASAPREVAWEAADLTYFAMVAAARSGIEWSAVSEELARRMQRLERRD